MPARPGPGREGRFRFTREIGQRLRELRRRSGLRQVDVTREMTGKARQRRGLEPVLARRVAKALATRYRQLRASLPPNPATAS